LATRLRKPYDRALDPKVEGSSPFGLVCEVIGRLAIKHPGTMYCGVFDDASHQRPSPYFGDVKVQQDFW